LFQKNGCVTVDEIKRDIEFEYVLQNSIARISHRSNVCVFISILIHRLDFEKKILMNRIYSFLRVLIISI